MKPFGEYYSKADCNTTDAAAGNCVSHGEVEEYVHVPEPIPEPSSIIGLAVLGTIGGALTLKRQIKSSKSNEK